MERLRILIAGCGYVGTALAARLAGDGHAVWGLSRRPRALPAQVSPVAADLRDPGALADLPRGLDAVFYTASAAGGGEAAYRAAYVLGLGNLLDALERDGTPRRVFFTSSTAVYGQSDGSWVDETSAAEPTGYRGRILLEAEARLRAGPGEGCVVRFGGIYGPGRARLLERVRAGTATLPSGPEYTNRIHRDDCAGALRHLLGLGRLEPLYLGVDDEPADRRLVLRWLAERLGVPPPREAPAEPAAGGPAASGKRCRNARLRASGYRFRYPTFREGYAPLADALRGAGAG